MNEGTNEERTGDDGRFFNSLPLPDQPSMERLHRELAASAAKERLLDVTYTMFDSPVGKLLLAATQLGLVRVSYGWHGYDSVLKELSEEISPRILQCPIRLDGPMRQLDEYFEGRRTSFDLDLDFALASGFRRSVLDRLASIPYGETESYAEVAAAAGNPRAVRAVGTACRLNPLPIIVPCHRVVRSDGSIGEYAGGSEVKRALLSLEERAG